MLVAALVGAGVGAWGGNIDATVDASSPPPGSSGNGDSGTPDAGVAPSGDGGPRSMPDAGSTSDGGSSTPPADAGGAPTTSDFCVTAPWTNDPQQFVTASGATSLPAGTYTMRYVGGAMSHYLPQGYEVSAHYSDDGLQEGHHLYNGATPETSSTSIWLDDVGTGMEPSVAATEQANAGLTWTITTTGGPLFITYYDDYYGDNAGPGSQLCIDVPVSLHDGTAACPTTCGPNGDDDCCVSPAVPGGTFSRSYDDVTYTDSTYVATISSFHFDKYDVTVGRFRAFLAAYPGSIPAAGAGKNPNDPNDPGWNTSWNALMPATSADLSAVLPVDTEGQTGTWTDTPGANETRPIGTVTWFEANAFCAWDGGRLPTEAEWNYAAAGGNEQRVYPWSTPPTSTTVDQTYADYNPADDGPGAMDPVGSQSPKGDGKWGQSDLVGNIWQWMYDNYDDPYAQSPCDDCADEPQASVNALRGGSAFHGTDWLPVSIRHSASAATPRWADVGFRCAR
jgi:formylglycine-generating enzyme required for sulfatase activity